MVKYKTWNTILFLFYKHTGVIQVYDIDEVIIENRIKKINILSWDYCMDIIVYVPIVSPMGPEKDSCQKFTHVEQRKFHVYCLSELIKWIIDSESH